MAEYICKNGVLRPINHIYQCVDRLIEGVDYEVYDQLYTDNSAFITLGGCSSLSIKAYSFSSENCSDLIRLQPNGVTFGKRADGLFIWRNSTWALKGGSYEDGELTQYLVNIDGIFINGIKRANGQTMTNVQLFNRQQGGMIRIKEVIIDNRIFSPCQLLRPISAALSSDNKPHPQGECGMYDSVSGKFYGNANTTGSFSVYND